MTSLYLPLVEKAFRIAAVHHREQYRKASPLPYLIHPAAVLVLLQRAGIDDEQILAAALLHDVLEDTACTLDELRNAFPEAVVRWVEEASERKRDDAGHSLPWLTRKQTHLRDIASASWQARAIVLADKLHNVASMLYDLEEGQDIWTRFNAPPGRILWYNREMLAIAAQTDPSLRPLRDEGLRLVEQLAARTAQIPEAPE